MDVVKWNVEGSTAKVANKIDRELHDLLICYFKLVGDEVSGWNPFLSSLLPVVDHPAHKICSDMYSAMLAITLDDVCSLRQWLSRTVCNLICL